MVLRAAFALLLLVAAVNAQTTTNLEADGRLRYGQLLTAEAIRRNIPPALADAVATVESQYDAGARGASGEIGLMQVLPSTADMLGFRGDLVQLADPATNIRLGVQYLAGAWEATGGRLCDTLMKYRAGYGTTTMSLRSAVYCRRALDYLASINSPLATGPGTEIPPIPPDMLANDAAGGRPPRDPIPFLLTRAEQIRMHNGQRTAEDSRRYWEAEEAHIRELRTRLEFRRLARSSTRALSVPTYSPILTEYLVRNSSATGTPRHRLSDGPREHPPKATAALTGR
jgi:Transglycosylase SLT domain